MRRQEKRERDVIHFSLVSMEIKLNHVSLRSKQGHFKKCKSTFNYLLWDFFFVCFLFEFYEVPDAYCLGLDTLYGQPKSATEMTFTKAFLPGCG